MTHGKTGFHMLLDMMTPQRKSLCHVYLALFECFSSYLGAYRSLAKGHSIRPLVLTLCITIVELNFKSL